MLIWIILFIIIIVASFLLAWRSMKDYREKPANFTEHYSVFLIQHPHAVTADLLHHLYDALLPQQLIVSFERLLKGNKVALVVYGPVSVLESFRQTLGLLELEDYAKRKEGHHVAWEMGVRPTQPTFQPQKIDVPPLHDFEQLWWQVVLQPKQQSKELQKAFHSTIRAVVATQNMRRSEELEHSISRLWLPSGLVKVPQPLSTEQLLKFYQDRALAGSPLVKTETQVDVKSEEILGLLNFVA